MSAFVSMFGRIMHSMKDNAELMGRSESQFDLPNDEESDYDDEEEDNEIAGINVEEYAKEMFAAGSALDNKKPEEIFYQDFKKFTAGNTTFGVGQITSMDEESLQELKKRMIPYIEKTFAEHGADMLFFMLTDIMEESTDLMIFGEGAEEAAKQAFHSEKEDRMYLRGVVSRKKQIIPQLMSVLQND